VGLSVPLQGQDRDSRLEPPWVQSPVESKVSGRQGMLGQSRSGMELILFNL